MEKRIAEKIVNSVMKIYSEVGNLDLAISEVSLEDERRRLVIALGAVLKVTREQMLVPIFNEFPELIPPQLSM